MIPIAGDLFSIVCILINAFRSLFVRNISNDDVLADKMLSLINERNKLKEPIDTLKVNDTKDLNWTRIDASNTFCDFPVLTLDQLNEITLGWFQLKQAKRYAMEHLSANGSFTAQFSKQQLNVVRARIQPRHRYAVLYNLYIQYSRTKIEGWYCECPSGGRIIGCCSHIATVFGTLAMLDIHKKGYTNVQTCTLKHSTTLRTVQTFQMMIVMRTIQTYYILLPRCSTFIQRRSHPSVFF